MECSIIKHDQVSKNIEAIIAELCKGLSKLGKDNKFKSGSQG